jgi:hypothetical protein
MADIELVIKIPEEDWKFIKDSDGCRWSRAILEGVINGTPLPKGHGRLIDADALADGFEDNYEFCEVVNATPTVIEADMRKSIGEKIRCNTCVNSDDELSGECYECVKGIFDHYESREADFPQAEDIEPTVERFKNTMDRFDDLLSDADMRGGT